MRTRTRTASAVAVLALLAVAGLGGVSIGAEEPTEAEGEVLPRELRCAAVALRRARLQEGLAALDLINVIENKDLDEDAYSTAMEHLRTSLTELDTAREALESFQSSTEGSAYGASFFATAFTRIDRIHERDNDALDALELLVERSAARRPLREVQLAIGEKDTTVQFLLGARVPPPPPRIRQVTTPPPDSIYVPVGLRGLDGVQYTFDTASTEATGVHPGESDAAKTRTTANRWAPPTLRTDPSSLFKRRSERPTNRYLAFRGTKRAVDGLTFHTLPNTARGPFEVELSAGLFRKAGKRHAPDARVSVEFDVVGSEPLDFFVISTRFVPADGASPSGVQVFTGSTGGVARGDVFLPDAMAADLRVVFDGGRFDVFARPLGAAVDDDVLVGSWDHGDAGERWTVGVGASRLRKGTELGIDDLVLTPR